MQSYGDTATDLADLASQRSETTNGRPESRKRWILNAFDVSFTHHHLTAPYPLLLQWH